MLTFPKWNMQEMQKFQFQNSDLSLNEAFLFFNYEKVFSENFWRGNFLNQWIRYFIVCMKNNVWRRWIIFSFGFLAYFVDLSNIHLRNFYCRQKITRTFCSSFYIRLLIPDKIFCVPIVHSIFEQIINLVRVEAIVIRNTHVERVSLSRRLCPFPSGVI